MEGTVTGQQPGEGWANPGPAAGAVVGGWAKVSGGAAYVTDIRAPDTLQWRSSMRRSRTAASTRSTLGRPGWRPELSMS
jgi:hypothetical protein